MAIDGSTSAFVIEPSGGACAYSDWAANPTWRSAGGRYFNNGQGPNEIIDSELVNYAQNAIYKIERQVVSGCARLFHGMDHGPDGKDPIKVGSLYNRCAIAYPSIYQHDEAGLGSCVSGAWHTCIINVTGVMELASGGFLSAADGGAAHSGNFFLYKFTSATDLALMATSYIVNSVDADDSYTCAPFIDAPITLPIGTYLLAWSWVVADGGLLSINHSAPSRSCGKIVLGTAAIDPITNWWTHAAWADAGSDGMHGGLFGFLAE